MAATALTPIDVPADYATAGVTLTFTAADAVNGNSFIATGREILLAQNTDASSATVTVTSHADAAGRTGDITADTIPASGFRLYQQFPKSGWADPATGKVVVTASAATVKFAVLRVKP